jgi:hypothetical protein
LRKNINIVKNYFLFFLFFSLNLIKAITFAVPKVGDEIFGIWNESEGLIDVDWWGEEIL